jgi:predicted nucleic acid-binding protein
MSGNKLLDTNILIYLSKRELSLDQFAVEGDKLYISAITLMEAKGFAFQNELEEKIIDDLCNVLEVINLNDDIIAEVIALRKICKIKLPDAIIFATAKCNGLNLITRNIDDFADCSDQISIIDPFKSNP